MFVSIYIYVCIYIHICLYLYTYMQEISIGKKVGVTVKRRMSDHFRAPVPLERVMSREQLYQYFRTRMLKVYTRNPKT